MSKTFTALHAVELYHVILPGVYHIFNVLEGWQRKISFDNNAGRNEAEIYRYFYQCWHIISICFNVLEMSGCFEKLSSNM